MPKVKTKSGAKKRFKLTGTGKIKRKHAFKSHILTKKTTKQKGFFFVKDEGIYVMNSYAEKDHEDNLVVYALDYDPHKDDDVWERSWRAVGRDDFAESIPLTDDQLTRLTEGGHLVLEVSETSIKIEA